MLGTVLCIATAACGIEVGWAPDPQGNLQYTIQIEPEMIDTLLTGRPIEYNLPPEHRGVYHFRFQVGKGKLPQRGDPAPPPPGQAAAESSGAIHSAPAASGGGWEPAAGPKQGSAPVAAAPQLPESPPTLELPAPSDDATTMDSPSSAAAMPFAHRNVALDRQDARAGETQAAPSPAAPAPGKLAPDPASRSLQEQQAAFLQPTLVEKPALASDPGQPAAAKLTTPLILTSCTAAGLLAACFYLCWIYAGARRRYRALLADYYAAVGSFPGFGPAAQE